MHELDGAQCIRIFYTARVNFIAVDTLEKKQKNNVWICKKSINKIPRDENDQVEEREHRVVTFVYVDVRETR